MAITVGTSSLLLSTSSTSIDFGSSADRSAEIIVASMGAPSSVTVGGIAASLEDTQGDVRRYRLLNPTSGSQSVVVNGVSAIILGVFACSGVNQSSPEVDTDTATESGVPPKNWDLTVDSETDGIVLSFSSITNGGELSAAFSGTRTASLDVGGGTWAALSRTAATGSSTQSGWTVTDFGFGMLNTAWALRPATGGSESPLRHYFF